MMSFHGWQLTFIWQLTVITLHANFDAHQLTRDGLFHIGDHLREQGETFSFILIQWIALTITLQADAVTKMALMGVMAPGKSGAKFDGSKPVTRYELVLTLWRFAQYLERADKQQKGKSQALAPKDGAAAVKLLIAAGYLPKNTALASGGAQAVTANQLSDALSAVILKVRAKKIPITPDSRYAPIPRPGGVGT